MSTEEAEAAAAAAAADMDELGKRKFFPRVRHLVNNKEWEQVRLVFCLVNCSICLACPHRLAFVLLPLVLERNPRLY